MICESFNVLYKQPRKLLYSGELTLQGSSVGVYNNSVFRSCCALQDLKHTVYLKYHNACPGHNKTKVTSSIAFSELQS